MKIFEKLVAILFTSTFLTAAIAVAKVWYPGIPHDIYIKLLYNCLLFLVLSAYALLSVNPSIIEKRVPGYAISTLSLFMIGVTAILSSVYIWTDSNIWYKIIITSLLITLPISFISWVYKELSED